MKTETCEGLLKLVDQVWEYFGRMSDTTGFDESMKALREGAQQYPSLAVLGHQIARECYPMPQPDSVQPERFPDIIGLIDNKQKFLTVLRQMPEESAPELEKVLLWMLKEWLPSIRLGLGAMVKQLPQRHAGGRPNEMPNPEDCRVICEEISKLHKGGLELGVAQKRLADRTGTSKRTIQRIWADRELWSSAGASPSSENKE